MSNLFQLDNTNIGTVTRFNLDDTYDGMGGITPEILGYSVAPYTRMAYDDESQCVYAVFGTKLWRGRLGGNPNVDLLWSQKPLANGQNVVVDIGGTRFFGSMDSCGCKVAFSHWYSYDRKLTVYDISSDTFTIHLIDDSTSYSPFYSSCCFGENEIIYVEFTEQNFNDQQFWAVYPDGRKKRLADPLIGGGLGLLYAEGKIWRINNVGGLSYYDITTDSWASVSANVGSSKSIHKESEDSIIAVDTGNANTANNKIYRYTISTDTVDSTLLTTASQTVGGDASFLLAEPTGNIDFDGTELTLCLCVKLTRQDGTIMGFTTHDRLLTFSGVTYLPMDSIQATAVRHEIGTGIANMDVTGIMTDTILSSEEITETELRAGIYDNANVKIYVVDWKEPSRIPETIINGMAGEVNIFNGQYKTEIRGLMQRMSQQIGELTSPTCRVKRLGDDRCKVIILSYQFTADVTAVQSARLLTFNDNHADGYFDYGVVRFTTGANAGIEREIKRSLLNGSDNDITLQEAFPYMVMIGDTAVLEAGCDRRLTTCHDKFNNVINFRGEPYIPGTDQLIKIGRMN